MGLISPRGIMLISHTSHACILQNHEKKRKRLLSLLQNETVLINVGLEVMMHVSLFQVHFGLRMWYLHLLKVLVLY